MRNFLILCLLAISTLSYSQKEIAWFDAALKVMYGSSSLLNNAAINSSNLDYEINFGNAISYGGKLGINRGYNGLAIELMYASSGSKFEYNNELNVNNITPQVDWKSLDLYLLFRNAKNLGFFEIGPKIGFLRSVERTESLDGTVSPLANINSRQISGVLGFGVNVIGSDGSFSGQIGLRLEYGFTDLIDVEAGSSEPFPFDANIYADGYEKSAPIFAGLVFELNWGIGAYGIAQCGARAKFFSL
ncbi:MAG: hypothetical protein ACI86M_003544 [Saprospiraceae bacterium]|jgi:hypothetical protein